MHGGNAVEAVLWLIFIAGNLFQLFKTDFFQQFNICLSIHGDMTTVNFNVN